VVVVLAVVVMGTQLSPNLHAARLAPASVAIAALWAIGVVLLNRAGRGLPWREGGDAPDSRPEPRGHSLGKKETAATEKGLGTDPRPRCERPDAAGWSRWSGPRPMLVEDLLARRGQPVSVMSA
jgi:hypothetical protein